MINKHNYLQKDLKYIKNVPIYEYDMKSAGLNILLKRKIITEKSYNYLKGLDKEKRNIYIGKYILKKYPNVNKIMMEEFGLIREKFIKRNNIKDEDILSIKKDALFLINTIPKETNIDGYIFDRKNKFTSFMYINHKEIFYSSNKTVFKNFETNFKEKQKDYLLKFIEECLYLDSTNNKNLLCKKILEFKYNFTKINLDKQYYIDINESKYLYKVGGLIVSSEDFLDDIKDILFIENNLRFLLDFISYIL